MHAKTKWPCKTLDPEKLQRNIMIKCQMTRTSFEPLRVQKGHRSPRNADSKGIKNLEYDRSNGLGRKR